LEGEKGLIGETFSGVKTGGAGNSPEEEKKKNVRRRIGMRRGRSPEKAGPKGRGKEVQVFRVVRRL